MSYCKNMSLVFHGGTCCGIKTVYGMGKKPAEKHCALDAMDRDDRDKNGDERANGKRFFHEEAPEEDGRARLERYIAYMKKRRPKNILEVVVTKARWDSVDQSAWFPVLKDLGFKRVNHHMNSNSGNQVHVFHLNVDEDYPGASEGEPFDDDEDEFPEDEED